MKRGITLLALIALLALGGWVIYSTGGLGAGSPAATATPKPKSSSLVSAEGIVVPAQRATLSFKTGGRVAEIDVREGDEVKAGTVLMRLDDAMLRAQVAQAQAGLAAAQAQLARAQAANAAQIKVAQAQLARLKAGASKEEIAIAEARVQEAATAFAQAKDSYDRLSWIGGPTEVKVRSAADSAGAALQTAQRELDRVRAGARPEDIAVAQAQLDLLQGDAGKADLRAAQTQVDQAQAALDLANTASQDALLAAPFDATVAAIPIDAGQVAGPGAPAVVLGNLSKLQIETTDLAEDDVSRVRVGQAVQISSDALPEQTLIGHVLRIAPMANDHSGDKVFKVTIALDAAGGETLKWGMTTNIKIDTR